MAIRGSVCGGICGRILTFFSFSGDSSSCIVFKTYSHFYSRFFSSFWPICLIFVLSFVFGLKLTSETLVIKIFFYHITSSNRASGPLCYPTTERYHLGHFIIGQRNIFMLATLQGVSFTFSNLKITLIWVMRARLVPSEKKSESSPKK